MKTVKILFFSVVFTLTFCFAAFASEKKIPATENFTNDVVYDNPRNLENADANNLAAFLPQIEKFQVKSVRVYPVYQKPGDTEDYYDSNIYVTASGGAYSGMTRTFDLVFPVQNTTQKYGNGYKGTFTYTSVTGNVVSLEAGGYVYLNSSSSDAQ